MPGKLYVGTSGWHYPHWRGVFYPAGMAPGDYLSFYAAHFNTVELNNSFYRLPTRDAFVAWGDRVPHEFVFALKASRYITHRNKLKDPQPAVDHLMTNASGLAGKLGPVLFQLPPRWHANPVRLSEFLQVLPTSHRYAFEFRDPTWLTEDVFEILREHGCALCVASSPAWPEERCVTADFLFLRFHGGKELYGSDYSRHELSDYASWARPEWKEGKDLYAYFNNDAEGHAIGNALEFRGLLAG